MPLSRADLPAVLAAVEELRRTIATPLPNAYEHACQIRDAGHALLTLLCGGPLQLGGVPPHLRESDLPVSLRARLGQLCERMGVFAWDQYVAGDHRDAWLAFLEDLAKECPTAPAARHQAKSEVAGELYSLRDKWLVCGDREVRVRGNVMLCILAYWLEEPFPTLEALAAELRAKSDETVRQAVHRLRQWLKRNSIPLVISWDGDTRLAILPRPAKTNRTTKRTRKRN